MILSFDHRITARIRAAGQPTLPLWVFLASHGVWGFVIVAFLLAVGGVMPVTTVIVSIVLTHVFTLVLQYLIGRERPSIAESKIVMWKRTPSFPSAHSSGSMAFAVALSAVVLPLGAWGVVGALALLALALGIGLSRIVVGVHYVGDVLAGFVFGALVTRMLFSVL